MNESTELDGDLLDLPCSQEQLLDEFVPSIATVSPTAGGQIEDQHLFSERLATEQRTSIVRSH